MLQSRMQLVRLVGPPLLRGMMWFTWHAAGVWSQPGAAQCRSRAMTARRRCAGMRSVTVPASRGRLTDAAGGPGAGGKAAGELVQQVVVDPAGDDRGQGGVAVTAGPRRRPARHRATR